MHFSFVFCVVVTVQFSSGSEQFTVVGGVVVIVQFSVGSEQFTVASLEVTEFESAGAPEVTTESMNTIHHGDTIL